MLALTLSTLLAAAPQEPSVLEVIPLDRLTVGEVPLIPIGRLVGVLGPADPFTGLRAMAAVDRDHFVQMQETVDPNDEQVSLRLAGDRLLCSGPASAIAKVRQTTIEWMNGLGRSIEIDFAVYEQAAVPPAAIATGADLERLLGNHKAVLHQRAVVRSGEVVQLGQSQRCNYRHALQVEVAQESMTSTPQVNQYWLGDSVCVRPHFLAGSGDLVLECLFASGQLLALDPITSGFNDQATLTRPRVQSGHGLCSGRIADGGALLLSLEPRAGVHRLLVVRATARPTDTPDTVRGLLLPTSALVSDWFDIEARPTNAVATNQSEMHQLFQLDDTMPGFDQDTLSEVIGSAVASRGERGRIYRLGSYTGFSDRGTADQARTALGHLENRLLRTATVTARAEAGDGKAMVRCQLPTLTGRELLCFVGEETTGVYAQFIEIAQKAGVAHAAVTNLHSGVLLTGSVSGQPQDAAADLTFDLVQRHHGVPYSLESGGRIEDLSGSSSRQRIAGPFKSGEDIRCAEGIELLAEPGLRVQLLARCTLH